MALGYMAYNLHGPELAFKIGLKQSIGRFVDTKNISQKPREIVNFQSNSVEVKLMPR